MDEDNQKWIIPLLQYNGSKPEQGSPSTTYLVMDVPYGVWFFT
jgi:hypothetical protein